MNQIRQNLSHGTSLVSIVIPVYNVEKYLEECLKSVINNTYKNLEIICVNDGSTDNSLEILNEYAAKDGRILVLSQENKGLAGARNHGIKSATGKWVLFVDSDDWIENTYIHDMLTVVEENDVDILITPFRLYDNIHNKMYGVQNVKEFYGKIPDHLNKLYCEGLWACGRLYKKEIIDEYDICFDEKIRRTEDAPFNFDYLSKAKTFYQTGKAGYVYRIGRPGQLTELPSKEKRYSNLMDKFGRYEHMLNFYDCYHEGVNNALEENGQLCTQMWEVIIDEARCYILKRQYKAARKILKSCKRVIGEYSPRTKNGKILRFFCKYSFAGLVLITHVYYGKA